MYKMVYHTTPTVFSSFPPVKYLLQHEASNPLRHTLRARHRRGPPRAVRRRRRRLQDPDLLRQQRRMLRARDPTFRSVSSHVPDPKVIAATDARTYRTAGRVSRSQARARRHPHLVQRRRRDVQSPVVCGGRRRLRRRDRRANRYVATRVTSYLFALRSAADSNVHAELPSRAVRRDDDAPGVPPLASLFPPCDADEDSCKVQVCSDDSEDCFAPVIESKGRLTSGLGCGERNACLLTL